MRNFDYLKGIDALKDLYRFCSAAEETQKANYEMSALNSRKALEWVVKAIYKLKHIEISDRDSLYELMTGEPFVEFIDDDRLMMAAHYIRKVGNRAAHDSGVKGSEAYFCLLNLYNLVGGVLLKLRVLDTLAPFNRDLIPDRPESPPITPADVPAPASAFVSSVDEEAVKKPATIEVPGDYSEAQTRKFFIDLMLNEAGWDVLDVEGAKMPSKAGIEIKVLGMPNGEGVGYVDYVLFGANGKPLAVVEAKRTTKDPVAGRHQAELYADCLEREYGIRPVIYYTNGYETFIIDGLGYPARPVFSFHTEEDLHVLMQRRDRKPITDLRIDDNITNREYQKRAIRSICEHLGSLHRRGLLVMATGTGKTRVAISLCEVLMRNGWVKNALFLADRIALVKQARSNFAKLLPQTTNTILSEDKDPDLGARMMFSTSQTMINYIDADTKKFSVGRFDLIIIDEAHRSVFGKYTAILDYFDAFMVGLTATPREDVDRSTYELFQMEGGEPNFAYERQEAVDDGFLTGDNVLSRTTDIMTKGIRYNELSEEERAQMEGIWKYEQAKQDLRGADPEKEYHRDITSREIFKYIFNTDTVDKVLIDLMTNGLKVNSGDTIGKTIIFAYNHQHAELIVSRFKALYPQLGDDFCVLIDNYINYAQDLIEKFEVRGQLPQVAVSVDMLDTGIDVPDILNLVFFKQVHSLIKFNQMIGRGTRLSPDIFDIGQDKKEFYIFDWCGNFEFFGKHPKGKEPLPMISLTERIFGLRTDLAAVLQHAKYQEDAFAKGFHDELKDILCQQVQTLGDTSISVRQHWAAVDKFRKKENWTYISNVDVMTLKEEIAPLLVSGIENEAAKKFDALILNIQLSMVEEDVSAERSRAVVVRTAQNLQERASIPQVAAKMGLINEIADGRFFETASLERMEMVRKEIRDLVQFILGTENRTFTINIEDVVNAREGVPGIMPTMTYKQRVIDYLARNRKLPVLRKIFNIQHLDSKDIDELERILWEELGTKEEYDRYVQRGHMICGDSVAAFIRSQIGVDRIVAVEKFSKFLSGADLNSMQEEYLKSIITYVCENGDITKQTLYDADSPFSEFDWLLVFGPSAMYIGDYVDNLHSVITPVRLRA